MSHGLHLTPEEVCTKWVSLLRELCLMLLPFVASNIYAYLHSLAVCVTEYETSCRRLLSSCMDLLGAGQCTQILGSSTDLAVTGF